MPNPTGALSPPLVLYFCIFSLYLLSFFLDWGDHRQCMIFFCNGADLPYEGDFISSVGGYGTYVCGKAGNAPHTPSDASSTLV